jgi:hypothetical protein
MLKDLVKVANRLDSLGLTREADAIDGLVKKMAAMSEGDDLDLEDGDIEYELGSSSGLPVKVWEEPPLDIRDVAAAFEASFIKSRDLDSLTVTNIRWDEGPSDFPHYIVESKGSYRRAIYDDTPIGSDAFGEYGSDEIIGREEESRPYDIDTEIEVLPQGEGEEYRYGFPVEGMDGKTYYLYAED